MKKLVNYSPTIGQSILISTISIVVVTLLITSGVYFAVFTKRTEDLIKTQSREINKQIVLNYENYINSVIETANYIQFTALSTDLNNNQQYLNDIFAYNSSIKKDVVSIYLFDYGGNKIIGKDLKNQYYSSIKDQIWFKSAVSETSISHFSAPHTNSLTLKSNDNVIFLSRSVDYTYSGKTMKGVLLIELNFESLTSLATKTNLGDGGHILILNDKDALIYLSDSSDNIPYLQSMNIAITNFLGGVKESLNNTEFFININTLVHTRWRIVTVNNVNDISLASNEMGILLIIIFIISTSLTGVISYILSKRITKPLNRLKDSMVMLENGDFYTKVYVSGQKEVVTLATYFNSMIDEIKSLMDKVVEEQRYKRKNELRALQNQINPHFLYNTLDSIVWLAESHRSEDVITTVIALARFFRISISNGATAITVQNEISHIENYLTIQKIRYVGKFKYKLEIADDVKNLKVMKLLLQPIVENAIYHGVGEDMELITIRTYQNSHFLIFEIENTGYGIEEDRIKELYTMLNGDEIQTSVGLKNVYQRIKLYYGESADLIINSKLDEYTQIKIKLPIERLGDID